MRWPVLLVLGVIIWFLLAWPFPEAPGAWGLDWASVVAGIVVAIGVALFFGEKRVPAPRPGKLKRYLWAVAYVPIFFWYCFLANLDVVYRVIHPDMPIRPGIVKVKTTLTTDSAITVLANSITLTPGTLTVDVAPGGYLYIHWIYVREEDVEGATRAIVSRFERILRRIYE